MAPSPPVPEDKTHKKQRDTKRRTQPLNKKEKYMSLKDMERLNRVYNFIWLTSGHKCGEQSALNGASNKTKKKKEHKGVKYDNRKQIKRID